MASFPRGACIYQIYPRSFQDSNLDGVGDIQGIIARLDYVASLGVDAIWLSPVFTSPMRDYGYDVADYCNIDPLFGSLDDFDELLEGAHARGLKLIIDQVYSHSSDLHPWFMESRASRENPTADWYVWADAKPDGSPPNNWQAMFGGPSWTWDARRGQYYLHNFLPTQPDLNVRNPAVQDALLNIARFWLERGVDGFRLDVANFYVQDAQLRDNPALDLKRAPARPHQFQRHLYDRTQPETLDFIARLRALTDSYDGRYLVGEIEDEAPLARQLEYASGANRLHSAYSFFLLRAREATPELFAEALRGWKNQNAWPSWSLSNHDVTRFPTRLCGGDSARIKQMLLLLACLPGDIYLYQGDELGLPHADVPFERLKDPEAIAFWPSGIGRDGARTPMPWEMEKPLCGFTSAHDAWLPLDPRHAALAADVQEQDPNSILNFSRAALKLRHAHDALRIGDFEILNAPPGVFALKRMNKDTELLCLFNLSDTATSFEMRAPPSETLLAINGASSEASIAILPARAALILS